MKKQVAIEGRFAVITNGMYLTDLLFRMNARRTLIEAIRSGNQEATVFVEGCIHSTVRKELRRIGFAGQFEIGPGTLYEQNKNGIQEAKAIAAVMI